MINAILSSKINVCDPHFMDMTKNEIIKQFKEDGITYTIYPTKDGRFKLRQPFQMCRKSQIDLLIELFRFYYGRDPDHDTTVENIFSEWIDDFKASYVATGHRSTLTHERYVSDWKRYFADSPIRRLPIITEGVFQGLKMWIRIHGTRCICSQSSIITSFVPRDGT